MQAPKGREEMQLGQSRGNEAKKPQRRDSHGFSVQETHWTCTDHHAEFSHTFQMICQWQIPSVEPVDYMYCNRSLSNVKKN